jgi:hypothetical protein
MGAFVETCGVSWEVYANFDQDLATNRTIGTFHYLVTELLELISKSRTAIEKLVQSRSLEAK